LGHGVYIYILGALAPWRNFDRCKIHFASKFCVLLYWQRHCTALQQRKSAKLRGVEKRAPPIFGSAITLDIGPHSSYYYYYYYYHVHVRYMLSPVRLSVCLSSVTHVHPTEAVESFGNISTAFGTLAIH